MREGAAFVRSSRLVGGLIIGLVGAFAGGGAVIGAGKLFVTSLGGGNAAYGVLFGSVFVGLGSGMAFGPRIARELSRRRLFGLAIVFAGALPHPHRGDAAGRARDDLRPRCGIRRGSRLPVGMTLMGTDVERRDARAGLRPRCSRSSASC